jgi:IclR family KDG regulon transcriptional repressor
VERGVANGKAVDTGEMPAAVASVERAMRILHMYLDGRQSLAVTEVAERLGVANSTAHRLLRSLCRSGVLQQSPVTKRYELSLLVYKLGHLAVTHSDLYQRALAPLEKLHHATGEGCHIGVPDLPDVVYFERRDSDRTMHFIARMGNRAPANCTSTGKVLLAFAPEQSLANVLANGLVSLTSRSITDEERLRQELALVRERGYARSCDEMEFGTTSVAAPIRDSAGTVVAALGVAGPTERMHRLPIDRLIDAVIASSTEISGKLAQLKRVRAPLASPFPQNGSLGLSSR